MHRRFREFIELNKELTYRNKSPALGKFAKFCTEELGKFAVCTPLPRLPKRTLQPPMAFSDVELRKNGLKWYLEKVLENPLVLEAYSFRRFIEEPPLLM